jgi:hypothetical protein
VNKSIESDKWLGPGAAGGPPSVREIKNKIWRFRIVQNYLLTKIPTDGPATKRPLRLMVGKIKIIALLLIVLIFFLWCMIASSNNKIIVLVVTAKIQTHTFSAL